eukprot:g4645.t1
MALGTGGFNATTAKNAVLNAYGVGFGAVHSAFDYFNVEGVGAGLARLPKREDVFVIAMTSPCIHTAGRPTRNVSDPSACVELTKKEVGDMLKMLRVDYVDLLLLHGPSEPFNFTGGCDETISALNRAQWEAYKSFLHSGKARSIGVSNFCPSCLEGLSSPTPSVNQIQWHKGMGNDPESLISYCRTKGIVVQAYSPLAGGEIISDSDCSDVGKKYQPVRSAAEVGLRWVVQHNSTAVVVKASNPAYLREDIGVFDWTLAADDMEALGKATTPHGQNGGRPSWGCAQR